MPPVLYHKTRVYDQWLSIFFVPYIQLLHRAARIDESDESCVLMGAPLGHPGAAGSVWVPDDHR